MSKDNVEIVSKKFFKAIKPKKLMSGSEWADTYRYVAAGTSPEPGRWQTSRVPYMREPMDMATKRSVEQVVIMAASQLAKSELLLNIMGYYIAQEPSSILFLQPTIDNAKAFSKERIDPTIKATPELRKALSETDDKATGECVLQATL